MRKLGIALIGLVILYCMFFPWVTLGYRMTVEVDTPDGLKTGSSVVHLTAARQIPVFGLSNLSLRSKGEAAYVDLGHGKNVVATLSGYATDTHGETSKYLLKRAFGRNNRCSLWCYFKLKWQSGSRDLKQQDFPTLVTFSDPTDPQTVRIITADEFPRVFGAGYHLRRINIELTDANVEDEIIKKLPWLDRVAYLLDWTKAPKDGVRLSNT